MSKWLGVLFLALLIVGGGQCWTARERSRPAGVLVSETPSQHNFSADERAPSWSIKDTQVQAKARFSLKARVLSREKYRFDTSAEISPIDLALGWGAMSDSAVLQEIEISQGHRFFYWRTKTMPIPRAELERSAANMHIIPANDGVEKVLRRVRVGDVVQIRGYLVNVYFANGGEWRTSLNREDTGNGACEIVYVESLLIE